MEQQEIETLKRQYQALSIKVDRLDHAEKKHDFIVRDSSVKIGIAEGLAKTTHQDISQIKLDLIELKAEVKELQASTEAHFEVVEQKIDHRFDTLMQRIDAQAQWYQQKFNAQEALLQQILAKLP